MDSCPICNSKLEDIRRDSDRGIFYIKCGVCGEYSVTDEAAELLIQDPVHRDRKYVLSGVVREETEHGNFIKLTTKNINDVLASASVPEGPLEAMDRILLNMQGHATTFSSPIEVKADRDYPVAYAKNPDEFYYHLNNLEKRGYINKKSAWSYLITLEGWQRLDELRRKKIDSSQAFVAMWFSEEMREAWSEGFENALESTGYRPIRIDLVQHNDKIDDRIIAEIRRSGLLVADLTGHRGGVYFEAGFAMGLGIPVIWTCREDQIQGSHFDTRQYNYIVWKDPTDLRNKLINRIEATLPNLPKRPSV